MDPPGLPEAAARPCMEQRLFPERGTFLREHAHRKAETHLPQGWHGKVL